MIRTLRFQSLLPNHPLNHPLTSRSRQLQEVNPTGFFRYIQGVFMAIKFSCLDRSTQVIDDAIGPFPLDGDEGLQVEVTCVGIGVDRKTIFTLLGQIII